MLDKSKNPDARAEKYWESNPNAAAFNQWTSNPLISENVYKRMSGYRSTKFWLSWLIEDYFKGKRFNKMLSPGCGTGDHEIIVARTGSVKKIDAFDISQVSIDIARKKAKDNLLNINFYRDNLNSFTIPEEKQYDLVLCSGSLHHVKELERFFSIIASSLKPDGYFIINEYVGDCYNIYDDGQIKIINRILSTFPRELLSSDNNVLRNSTINDVLERDPSESVRSKLIIPFLKNYFKIDEKNPMGGSILHPLYPFLDHEKFISRKYETDTILKLIIEFEAILIENSILDSDFMFCICRPK